jgi:lipopolysaccharide/colanic/teichoic acid biosynthesis glycosyltransferase
MQVNNKNFLVITEILLLLIILFFISGLFYPIKNLSTIIFSLIVWGLFTIFGYLFGEFEPTVSIYFGLNIRTQVIFLSTIIIYSILYRIFSRLPQFNLMCWLVIWFYLNLLAPIIGLIIRRILPLPIIFVTDQDGRTNLLKWWGYKINEQVAKKNFDEWLKKHSDNSGCIPNHYLILLDISNPISAETIANWVEKYFISFIGVKSYSMLNYLTGLHTRVMTRYPGRGTTYRIKRLIDFFVCLSVLFLLAPLFLFVLLCIKLDSPGSVFYRHRRLGKNMRPFDLLKQRTMYQDADKRLKAILTSNKKLKEEFERTFKLKKDPRITRTGRLIRQLSLDELPQILNVLKGDMSLVGPRPIVQAEIPYYQKYSLDLFRVLPGMTGLWQTSGRTETSYDERVKLDTQYVRTWSLLNDIKMLIRTVPTVISQRGAY